MNEQNFLPKMFFERLSEIVNGNNFPWFFHSSDLYDKTKTPIENFIFTHTFFVEQKVKSSGWFDTFEPILYFINEKVKVNQLIRMKLNLYTNQNKKIMLSPHWDYSNTETKKPFKDVTAAILNFTTCNGGTKIGDKIYASKANEVLIFNNTIKHSGIIQTDTPARIVLNINWR